MVNQKKKNKFYREYLKTSALGLEIALSMAIGLGIGFWIDTRFGCEPWGIVGGFVVGFLAVFRQLYGFTRAYLDKTKPPK